MSRLIRPRRRRVTVSLVLCLLALLGWVATRTLMWQWLNSGGEPVRYSETPSQPVDWMLLLANSVGIVTLFLTIAALAYLAATVVAWIRGRRAA